MSKRGGNASTQGGGRLLPSDPSHAVRERAGFTSCAAAMAAAVNRPAQESTRSDRRRGPCVPISRLINGPATALARLILLATPARAEDRDVAPDEPVLEQPEPTQPELAQPPETTATKLERKKQRPPVLVRRFFGFGVGAGSFVGGVGYGAGYGWGIGFGSGAPYRIPNLTFGPLIGPLVGFGVGYGWMTGICFTDPGIDWREVAFGAQSWGMQRRSRAGS